MPERDRMRIGRLRGRWCLVALFCLPLCATAGVFGGFDDDYDKKPWSEIETQLPAFPEKGNLIPFTVGAIRGTGFYVDGKSISVGADGVLRYTLVIVAAGGAENISYEGMRCDTAERRSYAFGRSDQSWSMARSSRWIKINGTSNNVHVELLNSYFCVVGAPEIGTPEDARRSLRSGGKPRAPG